MKKDDYLNKIICGDVWDEIEKVSDESVDLILFSPPYDGIRTYSQDPIEIHFTYCKMGKESMRVLKDGGVVIFVMQDQTKNFKKSFSTFDAIQSFRTAGLHLWECLIYYRDGRPGAWWSKRFRVDHEYMPVFFKGERPQYFTKEHMKVPTKHAGKEWGGTQRHTDGSLSKKTSTVKPTKCPGTVLKYATSNTEGNKMKMKHPATFPDKLASDMIQAFTKPGMIVLDPMCGSGTTLVQAAKLGRNFIGIDISEDYCNVALKRLEVEV